MKRFALFSVLLVFVLSSVAAAQQQPPGPAAIPADYILLTVLFRHDQTKTLDEINKLQEENGFWAKFPPEGIQVESWYIAMGLGYIVTLRVPPARLREVNRAVEQSAWKAFRTEFYPTYDAREIAKAQREKTLTK
jgi:hypothetical protein